MKIVIMGAGIIGISTAYFLARNGHQVIVLEKNSASGQGCSYANGGQLSYSHIEPLACASSLSLILRAITSPSSFLSLKSLSDLNFWKWSFDFLKNCRKKSSFTNSQKLFALGQKSKKALEEILSSETDLKFDYKKTGILHFYRHPALLEKAIKQAEFQQNLGSEIHILSKDECLKKEPTLAKIYDDQKLLGGIFYGDDASGNCLSFLKGLEKICREKYGVEFHYNRTIKNIFTNHQKITGVHTDGGVFVGDKYIYALGAYGNKLLQGIKIDPKIYPLKGYSLSIPADDEFIAPKIALTDVENKIVYSRIGDVFRAAGTIEACGLKTTKNQDRVNFLQNKIRATFSDFGNINQSQSWCGFRPVRANSIPLICEAKKYGNLLINAGHGHLGWTLSCGSAQIICDLIEDKKEEKFGFLEEEICEI